ncbi:hypothetical protein [Urbifossiella limnaea]|uniref:PhnA-like protein n=1 Tax=Urbifossiella limnaea TaxID=2528023 RepID=A0A517Y0R6_9BACT|nr:hypothetical protein [Urbifossiella limnaea]QDU23343.1 hypothetical protein ETAA1_53420 [Urbifossiella limnaea]
MSHTPEHRSEAVHLSDVAGVRSRVSWGALLGGAVVALSAALVFTFLFAAIGVSLRETDLRAETVGIAGIVAAVATLAASLFLGGWVTSQLTAGETRQEAVIYGVLTWALVTAASMMMVGMGVRAGYFALFGGTMVAQTNPNVQPRSWDDLARDAGVSQASIDAARANMDPARARAAANDTATREKAGQVATAASWGALAALLVSIAAAVGGSVAGSGPQFRLFPTATAHRAEIIVAR